jgi:hypothetical protein
MYKLNLQISFDNLDDKDVSYGSIETIKTRIKKAIEKELGATNFCQPEIHFDGISKDDLPFR